MAFFSAGARSLIGVDVGASAVKLVSGKLKKNSFAVSSLAIVPLENKVIDDRGITNPESVVAALLSAFEQAAIRSPRVATAIRGAAVLTKKIIISHFPKSEIPDQVKWEAEQVFPTDMSTIFIDHILLGEVDNIPGAPPGTPGWEILLIGVRQENVVTLSSVFQNASCEAEVIDLDSLVVADFLDDLLGIASTEVVAFVDVGASGTQVTVRHRGNVVFIREYQIGGNAFTETIAQALGLSFGDAEAIKIQDGSGIPQEAHEALQSILMSWKAELQQCEDIFVTQDNNALVSKWVLIGGGSLTPGLLNVLQDDHFGDKTVILPAHEWIVSGDKNIDENVLAAWSLRLITAAGLACRKAR